MALHELSAGIFISYETAKISGMKKCISAQLECTFDDRYQMKEADELLDNMGLDDNVSLVMHIDHLIYCNKI